MADKPFDRVVINQREKPLSSDINQAQSELDRTLRTVLDHIFRPRASDTSEAFGQPVSGFVGYSYMVGPVSPIAMQVKVAAGIGFLYDPIDVPVGINGVSGLNDLSFWKPLVLNADVTFNVPSAPSAPNSRYDIIEVKANRRETDLSSRDVLNAATGIFEPQNVLKTLAWDTDSSVGVVTSPANNTTAIGYKVGVASNPGLIPATSPGYIKIAEVYVNNGVTTVDYDAIVDRRKLIFPSDQGQIAVRFTTPTAGPLVPVLENLWAPPGVRASVVTNSLTNAEAWVMIMAGEPPISPPYSPVAIVACGDATPAPVSVISASIITITSVEQALLAGVQASPALKVAIGQKCYKIVLKATTAANPFRYHADVLIRGG